MGGISQFIGTKNLGSPKDTLFGSAYQDWWKDTPLDNRPWSMWPIIKAANDTDPLAPKNLKKQTICPIPTRQQPNRAEVDKLGGIVGGFPPRVLHTLKTLWASKVSG